MAPELLERKNYNEKVDIWSIGVITYMLLTGCSPFPSRSKSELKEIILKKPLDFEKDYLKNLSNQSIDFMKKALNKDYNQRYSAKQLLDHPWIADKRKEQAIDNETQ